MGYGGFFKTVVRIAIPAIVSIAGGGPLAIAISSAAATAATGGSFKEALVSAGTSYIGASIGQSVSSSLGTAGAGTFNPAAEFNDFAAAAGGVGAPTPGLIESIAMGIPSVNAPIESISKFGQGGTGLFSDVVGGTRTAFDAFQSLSDMTLGQLGINAQFLNPASTGITGANLVGGLVGGYSALTLQQALTANLEGLDQALLDAGFTPAAIQALKQEARNALSQQQFDKIIGATPKVEGLSDEDFNKIIAAGIERTNTALGPTTTQQAFDAAFNEPPEALGQKYLGEETNLRRSAYSQQVGDLFKPLLDIKPEFDDDVIARILDTEAGRTEQGVATAEARGNLNPFGGQSARAYIGEQKKVGEGLFQDVGNVVRQDLLGQIGASKTGAEQAAQSYQLGQPIPSFDPFVEKAQTTLTSATEPSALEKSLRDAAGPLSIFDLRGTINRGGGAQGLVAGPVANKALLDAFASREAPPPSSKRRGLGTQGAF